MARDIIRPKSGMPPRAPLSPAMRTTIVCELANPDFLLEIECVAET
jgi:hypothetical protein